MQITQRSQGLVSAILAGMLGVEPVLVPEPEDALLSFKPG
jgi:hypothetical protein